MEQRIIKANAMLLSASCIWGLAFSAQRIGAQYVGAFTFNAARFALGAFTLLILYALSFIKKDGLNIFRDLIWYKDNNKNILTGGIIAGCILFIASSIQQIGIGFTTAGKSAFITGIYIILVPIIEVFLGRKISRNVWIGAFSAFIGLYLLCINENFSVSIGDLLVFISSVFWAFHILVVGHFSKLVNPIKFSIIQYFVCSSLSLIFSLFTENLSLQGIYSSSIPIIYGGVLSVGVAFTLQVIGQRYTKPANASIILSMESVFGAVGGFFILGEIMSEKAVFGCLLMFIGMLAAQIKTKAQVDSYENKN